MARDSERRPAGHREDRRLGGAVVMQERMASASALLHVVRDAIDDEGVRQLLGCALKRPIPRPKAAHDRTRPASRLSASFGTEP